MVDSNRPPNLEKFRPYLALLARMSLGARLRAKVSESDIVQKAMLEAVEGPRRFDGRTEGEQLALLRVMVRNHAAKAGRAFGRQKRDVERERSLDAAIDRSSMRLLNRLADPGPSPSEHAVRNERLLAVARALFDIADGQREVVLLHFVDGLSTGEIATRLKRSPDSITGLLRRGLRRLRDLTSESG